MPTPTSLDWRRQIKNQPFRDALSFQFDRTSGTSASGDLSASGIVTMTLTDVPLGVNGADTNHYIRISGGTGTAETVLITGGSAVAGAASGTIICTTANAHTGAWKVTSATAGLQEAVNDASASSYKSIFVPPGEHIFYDTCNLNGASNIAIWGIPGTVKISLSRSSGTKQCIRSVGGALSSGTTITADAITFANRSTPAFVNSFTLTSATGHAVGNYIALTYNDGTYVYVQINKIAALAGAVVTLEEPLVIPLLAAHSNSVQKITLASGLYIGGIIFDGTSATGGTYSALYIEGYTNSVVDDVALDAFSAIGIQTFYGYRNTYRDLTGYNTGDNNGGTFYFWYETRSTMMNIRGWKTDFGFEPVSCTNCQFYNIDTGGSDGRGIKLQGCAWCQGSNIRSDGSSSGSSGSGLGFMGGSFRNTITNAMANGNRGPNGWGFYFSGEANQYNQIVGGAAHNNQQHDVVFGSNDLNNNVVMVDATTVQYTTTVNRTQFLELTASTASAGAVTSHAQRGIVTTEALTTAAGSSYTLTLTNNRTQTTDSFCLVSVGNGSNTGGTPVVTSVTQSGGSWVILIKNDHASAAFNGTLKIMFQIF